MRDSSPELDREFPGPYASTSVTLAPASARWWAVHAPNTPAPITITSDTLRLYGETTTSQYGCLSDIPTKKCTNLVETGNALDRRGKVLDLCRVRRVSDHRPLVVDRK
jgi:hypothetical protein